MSKEALVNAVKAIITHAKAGRLEDAYSGYFALFSSPEFLTNRPEDQRQALKLMILAKGVPDRPTPIMVEAHRAAVVPLTELVSCFGDPGDHEMLGICHVILGNIESAAAIFRAGLALERERNPRSDLCGQLMKRISMI